MLLPAQHGETVTLLRTEVTGHDEFGNDVLSPVTVDVRGVAVWPRTASRDVEGQNTLVISGLFVMLPPGIDVKATDRMLVRGTRYEVDGEPGVWRSYLTGTDAGTQVALRRVEG